MQRTLRSLCLFSVMIAIGAPATLPAQPRKAKPFTISGIVVDTKGKPVEGITVWVNADFVYGRASATTGADGRYEIGDLIKATYRAEAWVTSSYAGGAVCQRLAMPKPTDYNSFPVSAGAERNFRWQLTGQVGLTDSYFGSAIRIWLMDQAMRDASRAVEFTLTPTGPLVDGRAGAVIVKEASLVYPSSENGLNDIPLGTYRLKAVLIGKDDSRKLVRIKAGGAAKFQSEIELVWRAESRCGFGGDNGTQPFIVELEAGR